MRRLAILCSHFLSHYACPAGAMNSLWGDFCLFLLCAVCFFRQKSVGDDVRRASLIEAPQNLNFLGLSTITIWGLDVRQINGLLVLTL
jgi:hypothetical protein